MAHNSSPWRSDFPVFQNKMNGKDFLYLDTASSAQKPRAVVERLQAAYTSHYANIHRGLYDFSQSMTAEFEATRARVLKFCGASDEYHAVFTRNATESINLVAATWGAQNLKAGDEIILTQMEHHANIVPWQMIARKTGTVIRYVQLNENHELDLDHFKSLLNERTKILSMVQISNALGVINPIAEMIETARQYNVNILTMVDASQSVVHGGVLLSALKNPDLIVFTAHKLYGPNGVGVLIGRANILNNLPPYQGGGDMIETVSVTGSTYKNSPARFEAGTPAIAEVIALHAAIDYVEHAFQNGAAVHEAALTDYMMEELAQIRGIKIYAPRAKRAGIVSFNLDGIHHADVAMTLDQMGIAVRTGHHCCMPLMNVLGAAGTVRASIGLYSETSDIDALIRGLKKVQDLLG